MSITRAPAALGIAASVVLIGALTGCSTDTEPTDEPDPATQEPSSDPAPTSDPSEASSTDPSDEPDDDMSDPAAWVIDDGEIGPLELGDDFAETLGELPSDWANDEQCAYLAYWNAPEGTYLISFRHDEMSEDGSIVAASVESWEHEPAGPRTEDGLGVGSTRDEVTAAHPNAEEVTAPIGGGTFLKVPADDADEGALFFEFAEGGDVVTTVSVTTADVPAYEPCA